MFIRLSEHKKGGIKECNFKIFETPSHPFTETPSFGLGNRPLFEKFSYNEVGESCKMGSG